MPLEILRIIQKGCGVIFDTVTSLVYYTENRAYWLYECLLKSQEFPLSICLKLLQNTTEIFALRIGGWMGVHEWYAPSFATIFISLFCQTFYFTVVTSSSSSSFFSWNFNVLNSWAVHSLLSSPFQSLSVDGR